MRQAYFGRKSRKLVQGEDMKKRLELYRRGSLPVYWLSFLDFGRSGDSKCNVEV